MPAYIIADIDIRDAGVYDEYRQHVLPTIHKYGGRVIVRGGKHEVLEGSWSPHRLIVIEFSDMDTLRAWYSSPEYAPLMAMRKRATVSDSVAVAGA